MYKTRLQKHFNTWHIPGKLQSTNEPVNCTQHVLSNQVSTVHCVTQHSEWLCSFVCCSILCCWYAVSSRNQQRILYVNSFASFCRCSHPQIIRKSKPQLSRCWGKGALRGHLLSSAVFFVTRTTGNFLLPVYEVILWHSYFSGGKSAVRCRMLRRTNCME